MHSNMTQQYRTGSEDIRENPVITALGMWLDCMWLDCMPLPELEFAKDTAIKSSSGVKIAIGSLMTTNGQDLVSDLKWDENNTHNHYFKNVQVRGRGCTL